VLKLHDFDVVRRDHFALGVLDEARIHRMLDQRLNLGGVAAGNGANADCRCHLFSFSLLNRRSRRR
jgi:hypothetical protein